jgi:transposase-like protein
MKRVEIRFNGDSVSRKTLDEKMTFDKLPEKLHFLITTKTQEGFNASVTITLDPTDGMPDLP